MTRQESRRSSDHSNDVLVGPNDIERFQKVNQGVVPHYAVDAQRTPLRNRITGFLGKDVFSRCFVQGRPFFLGIDKGGGATLYVTNSLTLQT